MLRCGDQIILHQQDVDRLFDLTRALPERIHTVADWNRFIDRHLQDFEGRTPESRLLRMLLADESIQTVRCENRGCLNR